MVVTTAAPSSYAFFDLDGTLVRTEMPHSVYFFVRSLPGPLQRGIRLALFWPVLVLVGIVNMFSVDLATRILVFYALFNVPEADASAAAKGAMRLLQPKLRPQIVEALEAHKSRPNRRVYVLSGNIDVVIGPLVESLGCSCVATKAHSWAQPDGSRIYSGLVTGSPLLGDYKVSRDDALGLCCCVCVCVCVWYAVA
jgi:phosphoserine phosphatase